MKSSPRPPPLDTHEEERGGEKGKGEERHERHILVGSWRARDGTS